MKIKEFESEWCQLAQGAAAKQAWVMNGEAGAARVRGLERGLEMSCAAVAPSGGTGKGNGRLPGEQRLPALEFACRRLT